MKKLLLSFLLVILLLTLSSCEFGIHFMTEYSITVEQQKYIVGVGEELDLKSLFTVKETEIWIFDKTVTRNIPVTDDMIIAPEADFSREGSFSVTCTAPQRSVYKKVLIVVRDMDGSSESSPDPSRPVHEGNKNDPYTVSDALLILDSLTLDKNGDASTEDVYVRGMVAEIGPHPNKESNFSGYDETRYHTFIKLTDGEGGNELYVSMAESDSERSSELKVGDTVSVFGSLAVSGHTEKYMGWSYYHQYHPIFSIIKNEPGTKMPTQIYNESAHAPGDDILNDAVRDYIRQYPDSSYVLSTGLAPNGEQEVLVIPVQFLDDKFTKQELYDIELAFNGTEEETGWNSVSSYYRTSSYGKLELSFDIVNDPVTMPLPYALYGDLNGGADKILQYALTQIDPLVELDRYDTDKDGYIDAVCLIYSAPVDHTNDILSFYWAFVSQDFYSMSYDGVKACYYLFAGVDFLYESIESSEKSPIDGLKLNTSTFIHETGHLLGLDDYYDYTESYGSDEGLGNADMMDLTVGDHNAYSKLLLGWVTPTVITETQTVTIDSFAESGEFIMVLLDYDGTYFSEYLIIDLYTATGLNELHAGVDGSYLYDGEAFGARIYHVSSSAKTPFCNDRHSFTDNENSSTGIPLIKLVEADGDHNFESDSFTYDGYSTRRFASYDDLWQTGSSLSEMHPNYARNDGKLVNFDISFDSVTEDSATVTITFD